MHRGTIRLHDLRLAYVDFGGLGQHVLLLHGLMGRATTWRDTAKWLTAQYHVVGLDQRGHGLSDKPNHAYTRTDYVLDAAGAIEALGLAPAIVIGHSMGALNAWVLAARRPDLVRALVLVDMGANTTACRGRDDWPAEFASWPLPFSTMAAVREYFGEQSPPWADFFQEVFVERSDGYWPLFSSQHMIQTAEDWETHDWWAELAQVQCPTLVVKGANSDLTVAEAKEMVRRLPFGHYAEVPDADHYVHLDNPAGWRTVVEDFLRELP